MSTVLLQQTQLPPFDYISTDDFEPALLTLIERFETEKEKVISLTQPSWSRAITPLSEIMRQLDHVWSLLSHLKAVCDSEEIREVFKSLSLKRSEFLSRVSQDEALFRTFQCVFDEESGLDGAQVKALENALRSFKLNGVALPSDEKQAFQALNQDLVRLSNQFSENVLDSTEAWGLYLEDESRLRGVPESLLDSFAARARSQGHQSGYLLGLDMPSYLPVMQYCEDRSLRKELYNAYITRASNVGPHDAKYQNEEVMREIMEARLRKANLVGLPTYADLSVQPKMAESPDQVLSFLSDLLSKAKPVAEKELQELAAFAERELDISSLEMWDLAFATESLRRARFEIDQEALRNYFPLPVVLQGMFRVAETLFGVQLDPVEEASVPVNDARCYRIHRGDETVAYIYMDLYARDGKRSGAWVADCHKLTRKDQANGLKPVAFLVCNFSPPSGGQPSLLRHGDVVTLFHEFGHALHHCLTRIDYPEVSGFSGVPWDAVELPSQFLENWCWEPEVLGFLSKHVETGEALPEFMIEKLVQAKRFQSAMMTVRQLEFALFDFRLHHEYQLNETDIQALLEQVQRDVSVVRVPEFARFANAFSHIFAGGYAAGYYSYKWAEVLAADAFSAFQEEGVMNPETGRRFMTEILEPGGSKDVAEMFVAFRGRMPNSDALLKQMGM